MPRYKVLTEFLDGKQRRIKQGTVLPDDYNAPTLVHYLRFGLIAETECEARPRETKPIRGDKRISLITTVMEQVLAAYPDVDNGEVWTEDGKPQTTYLNRLLKEHRIRITVKERDRVWDEITTFSALLETQED